VVTRLVPKLEDALDGGEWELLEVPSADNKYSAEGIYRDPLFHIRNNMAQNDVTMDLAIRQVPHPVLGPDLGTSEVISIPEMGFKWRIVTKSPVGVLFHSHIARKRLWPLLESTRSTGIPLREEPLVFVVPNDGRPRRIYSADLSNATDTLSHESIRRICAHYGVDPRLVLSHRFRSPLGVVEPDCGTFMGLPMSWVILSLSHLAVCLQVDPSGRSFFLKGDDLVALWTKEQWIIYCRLMTQAGYKVHPKKSLENERLGFFCEKAYVLEDVEGPCAFAASRRQLREYLLRDRKVISVKFLSRNSDERTPEGTLPTWVARSIRFDRIYSDIGRDSVRKFLVWRVLLPCVPAQLRESGMWPLPLQLGGAGLSPDRRRLMPAHHARIYTGVSHGEIRGCSAPTARIRSELDHFVDSLCQNTGPTLIRSKRGIQEKVLDTRQDMASLITFCRSMALLAGKNPMPLKNERRLGDFFKRSRKALAFGVANTHRGAGSLISYSDAYSLPATMGVPESKFGLLRLAPPPSCMAGRPGVKSAAWSPLGALRLSNATEVTESATRYDDIDPSHYL
jgi:hypothetical protein